MLRRFFVGLVIACGCTPDGGGETQATGSTGQATGASTAEPTTGSAGSTGHVGSTGGVDPTSAGGTTSGDATSVATSVTGTDTGATSGPVGTSTGDPGTGGDTAGATCDAEVHKGVATYYAADGSGNCSYPATPDPLVAAMNHTEYAASATCGACVHIVGPEGEITVRIVDSCPECPVGHIDLSEGAFTMLAAKDLGKIDIDWQYVSCPVDGNISYFFKEGSNQWWTAVQVRNHRNAIATFEYKDEMGNWKNVARVDYNFFLDESGMGPGPYAFRVTDIAGNVLEDAGVPFVEAGESPGAGQFPACAP
jgi:expansin (peptidoglycan-binding protein)